MKRILAYLTTILLFTVQSCSTDEKDIERLSIGFVQYLNEYTKTKSGNIDFQVLDYKYSDIINGECEVSVKTKTLEENKIEYGTIYLKLKQYNDNWAVCQLAVVGSNDSDIQYNNTGIIDEATLNQLSSNLNNDNKGN